VNEEPIILLIITKVAGDQTYQLISW